MSTPRSPSKNLADQATADAFRLKRHGAALDKFEAAIELMKKTHTKNPRLKTAKTELYQATTVPEFMAATELFRGTTTRNKRISMGKDLLFAAAKIVSDAEEAIAAASRPAESVAAPAPAAPAPAAPAPVLAAPAPDVALARLSAPAHVSFLDKTNRVLFSAPATAPVAGAFGSTFHNLINFWSGHSVAGGAAAGPVQPAAAPDQAVKKRPVAELSKNEGKQPQELIDLTFSSDDEEPVQPPPKRAGAAAGGAAQSANGAGKAPKSPEDDLTDACRMGHKHSRDKVVYAADAEGHWTARVIDMMNKLKRHGLFSFRDMSGYAHDELRTLPELVALQCLQQFLDEENHIEDPNAFLIDHAQELRTLYGIEPACTIFEQHMHEQAAGDTESDDEGGAQ